MTAGTNTEDKQTERVREQNENSDNSSESSRIIVESRRSLWSQLAYQDIFALYLYNEN
jgi:hypothetical protein